MNLLSDGLSQLSRIILYGPQDRQRGFGILSFNVEGLDCAEVAHILDTAYEIAVRPGLHCAPAAHRTLGTFPHGAVRASVGPYSSEDEIHNLIAALEDIVRLRRG
jgi:selenocysteine lyase/cysteine desulfurase